MYLILIKKGFDGIELIANSDEELKSTINLALKTEYKIISVTPFNYELAEDFIKEKKKEIKPKGLVCGTDCKVCKREGGK